MKYLFILGISLLLLPACRTQKKAMASGVKEKMPKFEADPPASAIAGELFVIETISTDKTYGFTEENPIRVGSSSPANERRFLKSIYGPEGQTLSFTRLGSCCHFKTPNGMFNNTALLDMYEVSYDGLKKPVVIYIDMYDYAPLSAPKGFTLRASSKL
jgi:hypothetical protein